jgi:hypothetical protein
MELKEIILNIVNQLGDVTFTELEQELENKELEYKGSIEFFVPNNENVVFWKGISEPFAKALEELIFIEPKIFPKPVDPFLYYLNGKWLEYPVAKNIKYKYRTRHWYPVILKRGNINLMSSGEASQRKT